MADAPGVETPVTWRCCATCPKVAMLNHEISLAGRIRTKLDAGQLPRSLSPALWSGIQCAGCREPTEVASGVLGPDDAVPNYRLHKGCVAFWQAELLRR